jgi:benzoyl-CoA reductase subunit BamC
LADALTYEEREEIVEVEEEVDEVDVGLEALANKHGWKKIVDSVARMTKKD